MQRELSSFSFSPSIRTKLSENGFTVVKDIALLQPSELSEEIGISRDEALQILNLIQHSEKGKAPPENRKCTALEALMEQRSQQMIVTFSQAVDGMLGGGVPLAKITEFCGAPGIGKTQMSIQLCVAVQLPEALGGVQGEAVFIDTEGSFVVERVADVAKATVEHCRYIANTDKKLEQATAVGSFSVESVLRGIHYFRCHSYTQLIALSYTLTDFLKQHPKVRLIVVDSIAFHFRHDFDDYALRTRLLNGLAQNFIKLATLNKLAVVLTNQMTTRFRQDAPSGGSHLIPALGESWGHASTVRVILFWRQQQRHALLYKSPSRAETVVAYQITTAGIRDVNPKNLEQMTERQSNMANKDPQPCSKRQRIT